MTCKSIITTFHSFLNARISPKEISGASGGFLPRPLLLRLRYPNSKKNQPRFCQILSPKNSFGKTESAFRPATLPEYLEGRTPKENTLSFFKRNFTLAKSKMQGVFSFGVTEALRGGGEVLAELITLSGLVLHVVSGIVAGFRDITTTISLLTFACIPVRSSFLDFLVLASHTSPLRDCRSS